MIKNKTPNASIYAYLLPLHQKKQKNKEKEKKEGIKDNSNLI